jgi:hypothetical protein
MLVPVKRALTELPGQAKRAPLKFAWSKRPTK